MEGLTVAISPLSSRLSTTVRPTDFSKGEAMMKNHDVIRAWKDEQYRSELSQAERDLLPENPAGSIEIGGLDGLRAAGAVEGTGAMNPFEIRTCIGICTPTQDMLCGVTVGLCSFLDPCPSSVPQF